MECETAGNILLHIKPAQIHIGHQVLFLKCTCAVLGKHFKKACSPYVAYVTHNLCTHTSACLMPVSPSCPGNKLRA